MWRRARKLLTVALAINTPAAIAFVVLAATDRIAAETAAVTALLVVCGTTAIVAPFTIALIGIREWLETLGAAGTLGPDRAIGPARGISPSANALRRSLHRLERAWRRRLIREEARREAVDAVIAGVPDPLILLDARRQIIHANPRATEFVGVIQAPRDLADSLRHPAVLEAADAVLAGVPARDVEFAVSVPVERRLRARFARLPSLAGDGAVAILTLSDITVLKRAEQMRADFIANASHELRTPLTTLIGFIETLRGPARGDAKARDRFLSIMHEQALRMSRVVHDLLSLSRIEMNEHVVPTSRIFLEPVVQDVVNGLELRAAERRVRIVLDLPPDLPPVSGDRDELAQVLQNLLDNALKYGKADTEIAIRAAPVIRARIDGDRGRTPLPLVQISVEDHGDGIPSEHLGRLTERFYRIDTARSRELGGTGLGLAIVKHILNRHRGFLEIDSVLGRGSVFTVLLHRAPPGDDGPVTEVS